MAIPVHISNRDSIPESQYSFFSKMSDQMMTYVLAFIGVLGFVYISFMICSSNDCRTIDQISVSTYNTTITTPSTTQENAHLVGQVIK